MPRDQYTFGHTTEWPRDAPHGNRVTHKVQVRGTVTMGELAAELTRLGAPDAIYLTNAQITWDADATLEKIQEREGSIRAQIERTRAWEIDTLKRLQEKYPEIDAAPVVEVGGVTARPLSALQLKQLSAELNPARVAHRAQGRGGGPKLSYLEAWDVRTALIRIFGYGGYSYETTTEILQVEPAVAKANGQGTQFRFTVMATVKLYIAQLECYYQESAVSSQAQPDPGECADFAVKTAESDALKRCAVNLGTQFGLSLYNKGATADVVKVVRAPEQAAILACLAQGETAASIDASIAKSLEKAVDVAEPADNDRTYGYDPDHGDTGLEGSQVTGAPAPGEDPADDVLPEPSTERTAAARAGVRAGFTRVQP